MKTILSFTTWFVITFIAVSVVTSALAAEPVKPLAPPADCSCGACE